MAGRCVLILLDGLGDRAYQELNHRTPLQAARTPHLDRLASLGANGIFHAGRLGEALPSENAHFAMFGYQPDEFPGRGCLEALGAGIHLALDDVALLAHFVHARVKDAILIMQSDRPRVTEAEGRALAEAVAFFEHGPVACRFVRTRGLDGIIVLSGHVSPHITDSDPLTEGEPVMEVLPFRTSAESARANHTSLAINAYLAWCYEILSSLVLNQARDQQGLPRINALVTQRPGQFRAMPSFEKRWGIRGLSIASGLVYHGLAAYLGMDVHKADDSDDPGRDLAERLALAHGKYGDHQFVHVHSKAPDVAAHTKNPQAKVAAIESLDTGLAALLDGSTDADTVYMVTADHSTPSRGPMIHSGEPVPLCMVGPGVRRDPVQVFDEVHCGGGCLGTIRGNEIMPLVLNALDRGKLRGLMDTPEDQRYWPGKRRPFLIR